MTEKFKLNIGVRCGTFCDGVDNQLTHIIEHYICESLPKYKFNAMTKNLLTTYECNVKTFEELDIVIAEFIKVINNEKINQTVLNAAIGQVKAEYNNWDALNRKIISSAIGKTDAEIHDIHADKVLEILQIYYIFYN